MTKTVKKTVKKKTAKKECGDINGESLLKALLDQVNYLFVKVDELEERVEYLEGEKLSVRFDNFLYRVGIKKD